MFQESEINIVRSITCLGEKIIFCFQLRDETAHNNTEEQEKHEHEGNTSLETVVDDEALMAETETSTRKRSRPSTPTKSIKKKKVDTSEERLNKAFELLQSSANIEADDSYHFGNLVASKLRKYDEQTRCAIQSEILSIFFRANRTYNNRSINTPSHDVSGHSRATHDNTSFSVLSNPSSNSNYSFVLEIDNTNQHFQQTNQNTNSLTSNSQLSSEFSEGTSNCESNY